VAANPNNPGATARPKVRSTMSRIEVFADRISELEAQLAETRTPSFLQFLKEHLEDIYYPEHRFARAVVVTSAPCGVRGLLEQRLSRRLLDRPQAERCRPSASEDFIAETATGRSAAP